MARLSRGFAGNELALIQRADFLIEAEVQAIAAEERRRAVLEGLAGLGYEVSEGMATAWVMVAELFFGRRPIPDTALSFPADRSPTFSSKSGCVRQFDRKRDTSRDRDIETIWCGEFERLQSLIAKDSGNLAIEHARPVGQFPLKVVRDLQNIRDEETTKVLPRQLPR